MPEAAQRAQEAFPTLRPRAEGLAELGLDDYGPLLAAQYQGGRNKVFQKLGGRRTPELLDYLVARTQGDVHAQSRLRDLNPTLHQRVMGMEPLAGDIDELGATLKGKPQLLGMGVSPEQIRPGQKLPAEYVYHNTRGEQLREIEEAGFNAGAFSERPIDFGGDVWIAARKADLPNVQTHDYGGVQAFEPNFVSGYDAEGFPIEQALEPAKLFLVDKRGRVIRQLGTPSEEVSSGINPGAILGNPIARDATAGAIAGAASANLEGAAEGELPDRDTLLTRTLGGALVGAGGGAALRGAGNAPALGRALTTQTVDRAGQAGTALLDGYARRLGASAPEIQNIAEASWQELKQDKLRAAGQLKDSKGQVVKPISALTEPRAYLGEFFQQWRENILGTVKNVWQDKIYARFMNREFGPQPEFLDRIKVERDLNRRAGDSFAQQSNVAQEELAGWTGQRAAADIGSNIFAGEADRPTRLNRYQRMVNGAIMGVFNPSGMINPVGGVLSGATRGALQPAITAAAKEASASTQNAAREALFVTTFSTGVRASAEDFLGTLAKRGVDVSALEGRRFRPQELEAVAGRDAAQAWRTQVAALLTEAESKTKYVFGDYSDEGTSGLTKAVSKVFPFTSFYIKSALPAMQVAARHPGPALGIAEFRREDAERAKAEGRAGYQAGTVKVPGTDFRIDPVSLFSPLPTEPFAGDEPKGDRNIYQRAKDLAGKVGFQPNPLIQMGAYAVGADYQAPGPLSRAAGIEGALPGPYIESPAKTALDKAHEISTGLWRGNLAKGKKPGPNVVEREMATIVRDETGRPLSDPTNTALVAQSLDKGSDLYRRAEVNVRRRGGESGVLSLGAPLSVMRENATANANRLAKEQMPYTYEQIAARKELGDKRGVATMDAANARYKQERPDAAIYDKASAEDRKELLVAAFERANGG